MAARERDHQSEPGGPSTPAPSSEPAEQARASTPAPPVRDPEPPVSVNAAHRVPDSPASSSPVSPDIEQAATALAMRVWQDGAKSRDELVPAGSNPAAVDQYLDHAEKMQWLRIDGDDVERGVVNPRPMEPIAPDSRGARSWLRTLQRCTGPCSGRTHSAHTAPLQPFRVGRIDRPLSSNQVRDLILGPGGRELLDSLLAQAVLLRDFLSAHAAVGDVLYQCSMPLEPLPVHWQYQPRPF
jgi:hypothetical protein